MLGQPNQIINCHFYERRNNRLDICSHCSYIVDMITVGIRNLKNSLSQYINMVKTGEKILITDHNRIVAELIPSSGTSSLSGLLKKYLEEQTLNGSIIKSTRRTKISKTKKINKYDKNALKNIYEDTRNDR